MVQAGWKTTCAVTVLQPWRIVCWGDDTHGIVSRAPTLPTTWSFVSLSLGDQHACAIVRPNSAQQQAAQAPAAKGNTTRQALIGGNVTCWGDNKFGRVTGTFADGAEYAAAPFPKALQGQFAQVHIRPFLPLLLLL